MLGKGKEEREQREKTSKDPLNWWMMKYFNFGDAKKAKEDAAVSPADDKTTSQIEMILGQSLVRLGNIETIMDKQYAARQTAS